MEVKKLYTCGCSFMSLDLEIYPGTLSFLDLYAQEKNVDHISLGRSGATNFLIRLQIEEAIKQNADYVIIGATSPDRIDFPLAVQENLFKNQVNLSDVEYRGYKSKSALVVKNTNPLIISDSINNFTDDAFKSVHNNDTRKEVNPQIVEAIRYYLAYLHHNKLQITKDYYMISDGLRKLMSLDKPFIFIPGPLRYQDWSFIGNRLWQGQQPWDMPHGFNGQTINHNPQSAHDEFVKTLLNMTHTWK